MLLDSVESARDYAHVYVAPHPDDAVLSCGGQIAQHVVDGARVLVVTVCAASPRADEPLTPYAEHLHRTYGLGVDPMAGRRDEDARAFALLGCDGLQLDQLDAPYRLAAYGERGAVFGRPVPGDPLGPAVGSILDHLLAWQPAAHFYLPLGVGSHVDHQIVCAEGLARGTGGANILWYEDAPYAIRPELVAERLAVLGNRFEPLVVPIGPVLGRKLTAITAYGSQVRKLFREQSMEQAMTAYAAAVGGDQYGERLWRQPGRRAGRE